VDGVGAADGVRAGFGEPEVQHLAVGDQLRDRSGGLLDRRVRVDAVLVVQVDVVSTKPFQGPFDGCLDVG
jgi:hypothetical protein